MKKKIALITLVVVLVMSFAQSAGAINVIMNSTYLPFPDQEPVIVEGTTLVPIRTVAEALGLEVTWDDPTDTVVLKKDKFFIELVIGSTVAKTSSGVKSLLQPPVIINSRTMVPLRFIAEELGLTVHWNDTYKRIVIVGSVDTTVKVEIEQPTNIPREEAASESVKAEVGEVVEAETDAVEYIEEAEELNVVNIEAGSATIILELPMEYVLEDTESEESFAYRSIDAFDAQHTYNWEKVTQYESYVDGSATNGLVLIVQELSPYEGDECDLSLMNAEYPEAPAKPERPSFPDIDWQLMQEELERVLLEQVFMDMGMEIPEDLMSLEEEQLLELLGFESVDELSAQLEVSAESADLSQVPGYDEYLMWQEENELYREEQNLYREEYNAYLEESAPITNAKEYAYRKFGEVYSNASNEEWVTFFTTRFNSDEEVRYEGVEIIDFEGKMIIHATINAEDPDDEQGVYEYYHYMDGDTLVTIFGGTLFGSEAAAEVVDILSNMSIR